MLPLLTGLSAAAACFTAPTTEWTAIHIDVGRLSTTASPLNKQLMSLSIEFDTAVAYFGDVGRPNLSSKQLLQNVADRAGVPAVLRIGGNTQDRASFCADCNETMTTVANTDPNDPKQSEALYVEYNKDLFEVLTDNVPEGNPIIFGLNFRNKEALGS